MKRIKTIIVSTAIMLSASVFAQETGEKMNIFKPTGAKETAKDFTPAPDKIETSYGTLEFVGGALPTEESTQKIFDQLDLQRATQAYMDFMPA
ncbi:MAG: hypothetical protein WBN27_09080, partial [Eudoraea sp.]|uniref:hypothetical protein n=1 Tax=Eudoraea sp. TaxID=1979955 RepID=UPI003C72A95A